MKEIIFVTPNLSNGGAERVTSVLASEMAARGIHVVLAVMLDEKCDYNVPDQVEKVVCYREGGRIRRLVGKIIALRRLIRQRPEASVVAMLTHESIYTYIASIGLRRKIIYSLRNDPGHLEGGVLKTLLFRAYGAASGIVFQTEDARDYFPRKIREKGTVIPNPLREDCPKPYFGERTKEIVSVGRLGPQKNFPLLLSVFAKIAEIRQDWRLKIYGEGELRESLEQQAEGLGIADKTMFMGFCRDVNEQIVKSGVFVMPSDYEGISNAMLEALAMGVPCVCTDCPIGGARLFIHSGENGFLVPVRDEKAMETAILNVIDSSELRRKFTQESVKIRDILSAGNIADRWIKWIDER